MHRQAVRVWCLTFALALTGCEVESSVRSEPKVVFGEPTVAQDDIIVFKLGTVVSKVKLLPTHPPTTLSLTEDSNEQGVSYVSRTEHDCEARMSTLKYLAVFDDHHQLLSEATDDVELEIDPDSLGEAEQKLACPTPEPKGTAHV